MIWTTLLRDRIAKAMFNAVFNADFHGAIIAYLETDEPDLMDTARRIDGTINFAVLADAVIEALPELNPDHVRAKYLKDWEEGYDDNLRDRIAAVLDRHYVAPVKYPLPHRCRCGWTANDTGYGMTLENHSAHVADAVIAALGMRVEVEILPRRSWRPTNRMHRFVTDWETDE